MGRKTSGITVIILFLLLWAGPSLQAQRSLIRTYTVGDGLVMNRVRGFHQDMEGFIWMNTWDGLSRYEGYRFRNYIAGRDLQYSFVNEIYENPDSSLYLPLNDGSLAVMHDLEVDPKVLMPGDVINAWCKDDEGKLYVSTDHNGICLFDHGKVLKPAVPQPVKSVDQFIFYKDHFFFIGPYEGPSGVYDKEFNLVGFWPGIAVFSSIYKDHHDRIFVCTVNGLQQVDLNSPGFELKMPAFLPSNAPWLKWNVRSVVVTPDEDIFLGTDEGLVHLRSDQSWDVITMQDGLLSNRVGSLFLDRSNTLWIGTDAGAASINLQTNIDNVHGLPGVASNFFLPDQDSSVYIITDNTYLSQVDQQMNVINTVQISDLHTVPLALIPEKRGILLITQESIIRLDTLEFPFHSDGIKYPTISYTKLDDTYWITTGYGFQCCTYPGKSHVARISGMPGSCTAPARNGQLLIGTLEDGVVLARHVDHDDACQLQKIKDFSAWIDDPQIRSMMTARNGDVWIGSRFGGLTRLRCNDDYSDCKKQRFTMSDGLVSNWITSIAEDQSGNIWVGSASGIDKLVQRNHEYFVFSFSRIHEYYVTVRQLMFQPDGSLWVGHNEGLDRIMDGRVDTVGPLKTFITEANLGGNNFPTSHSSLVRLPYNQNSAHFAFAAPDYINTSQLKFTYRLLGSKDESWSAPVTNHEIFYGNLRPGNFRFEVAAFGWNGQRSTPVGYDFVILQPFWNQAGFILLSILLIASAVYGLYLFRISQIRQVQSVRDRIAADLHDEIGSSLTHINILSEIGKRQVTQNGNNLFERIGTEVQTSSEALDDIIWSVRTRRDAIGDVIARMRQYATEIFDPADIKFQFHEHVEGIQSLEMEFKRDFYLVYKEVLRNILRHAGASNTEIVIHAQSNLVTIQVSDNGRGFDPSAPTQRNGLSNIKSRVKKWHGTASWNTAPGKGTQVTISMKPD